MESMKRIDVLKGIEQILIQKAYETGHISHRADGDWQKQADGSWKPYTGQSNQSAPQTQEPTENTEYGEITEEDLRITDPSMSKYNKGDQKEWLNYASNTSNPMGIEEYFNKKSWLDACDRYGVKPTSDPINTTINKLKNQQYTYDKFNKAIADMGYLGRTDYKYGKEHLIMENDKGVEFELVLDNNGSDFDWKKPFKVLGVKLYKKPPKYDKEDYETSIPTKNRLSKEEKADINNKIYNILSLYDSDSKKLFGVKRIDGGGLDGSPSISYDWKTDKILPADKDKFDKTVRHYMNKAGIEDTPLNYKQAYNTIKGMAINNGMLKVTNHPLDTVNKSYRDMRFAPTTKNMGF